METVAEAQKAGIAHAWDWFVYHANQRMTMIRFYLTVAAAIGGGVGYLLIAHEYFLSAVLSLFGAMASICFLRLDRRVSVLVKLGEEALKTQQLKLAATLGAKEFEICARADEVRMVSGKRHFAYPFT